MSACNLLAGKEWQCEQANALLNAQLFDEEICRIASLWACRKRISIPDGVGADEGGDPPVEGDCDGDG